MSQEVAITATVKPAPGKLDRFKELLDAAINRMEAEEPGTIQFEYYQSLGEDDNRIAIFERYTNKEAMDKHTNSPEFRAFFKALSDEQVLEGPPEIFRGRHVKSLRR